MNYTFHNLRYSAAIKSHLRSHICTCIQEAAAQWAVDGFGAFIEVYDNRKPDKSVAVAKLSTMDEIEEFTEVEARNEQWKDKKVTEWNPMSNLLEDSPESTPKAVEATVEKPLSEMNTQKVMDLLDTLTSVKEPKVESVAVKDHINPSHYQSYLGGMDIEELQWLEAKQYQNHWRNPEAFKAAVMLQADKYQSRMGGKDEDAQELLKAVWYLKFLAAYIKNGNNPIRVKDIQKILGE